MDRRPPMSCQRVASWRSLRKLLSHAYAPINSRARALAISGTTPIAESEILQHHRQIVDLCAELTRCRSPNPPGDTRVVADFVGAHLARLGLEVKTIGADRMKPNLIAAIGQLEGPRIVLCSHMDTFPPPPAASATDAYSGRIDQRRVYGTGVGDMRCGLAIALFLAGVYKAVERRLRGALVLAFSSDEESGGENGARILATTAPEVVDADACIIGDQTHPEEIGCAEKGFCWLELAATAAQTHAAYAPSGGAVQQLLEALSIARSLEGFGDPTPPSELGLVASPLALRTTVNVGRLEAGVAPNLTPDRAAAAIDIRLPFGVAVEEIMCELRVRLRREGSKVFITQICSSDATATSPSERVVQSTLAEFRRIGVDRRPSIRVGMSDAHIFRQAGIPTVVLGPCAHNLASVNEYVEIDEAISVARVHAGIIESYVLPA